MSLATRVLLALFGLFAVIRIRHEASDIESDAIMLNIGL